MQLLPWLPIVAALCDPCPIRYCNWPRAPSPAAKVGLWANEFNATFGLGFCFSVFADFSQPFVSDVFAHELCVFMIYGVRFSGSPSEVWSLRSEVWDICACTRCLRLCWLTCCVVVARFCASLLAGFAVGDRFVTFSCKPRTYKSNLSRSLRNEVVTVFPSDSIRFELIFDCHTIVTWNDAMHELCPSAPHISHLCPDPR